MIEKMLENQNESQRYKIVRKVNEIIDLVNEMKKDRDSIVEDWIATTESLRVLVNIHEKEIDDLQMKVEPEKLETYLDKAKDWIGFLCRFKDREDEKWHYGILKSVDEDTEFPFWDENDFEWAVCQLVEPTDTAIKENNIEF